MAKTKKVLIQIKGGMVVCVRKPKDVELKIQDFDIASGDSEPENRDDCKKDRAGNWYQEMVWKAKE